MATCSNCGAELDRSLIKEDFTITCPECGQVYQLRKPAPKAPPVKDLVDERYGEEEPKGRKGKKAKKAAKADKPKKPIYKKWWFWVLVVLVVIAAFPSGNNSTPAPTAAPVAETTPTVEETTVAADAIVISYDQVGEYGEARTLNANTDMPTSFIAFKIPGGVYDVTNKAAEGTVQVTVYSGVEFDGQWEQFVADNCDAPIVLFSGETKPLTIQDGQFVKLSDGGNNVQFVKTGNVESWDDRFARMESEVLAYVDNTITGEYQKRIPTTLDYYVGQPDLYDAIVEIVLNDTSVANVKSVMRTVEERMDQAPYRLNITLVFSASNGAGVCFTSLGEGYDHYSIITGGHKDEFNSIDEIPDNLF